MKRDCREMMMEIAFIMGLLVDLHVFLFLLRFHPFDSLLTQNILIVLSSIVFVVFFLKLRETQDPLSLLELIAFKKSIEKKDVVVLSLSVLFGAILGIVYWLLFANINNFYLDLSLIPVLVLTLVSILEEVWFRGIVHGSILHLDTNCLREKSTVLVSHRGQILELLAIAVGAISFVTYHLVSRGIVNVLVIFLGGIILGLQRSLTKSIFPSILTHVTYNLILLPLIPL